MNKVLHISVSKAEEGQKLLQFIERRLGGDVPRSAIMKWIRTGQVRVDKGRKKPFDRIKAGQDVRIPPHQIQSAAPTKNFEPLEIVHNKNGLLAVNKPSGLAAHGGEGHEDSVAARLDAMYPDAEFRPTLCHRLDRDTSGLILAATSYSKLREMNELFAGHGIDKLYLAWVRGQWKEPGTVLLEDRLEKKGAPGKQKVKTGSGKQALAEVTCLESSHECSLLAIRLLTGRTHQIRVQLASRKHPIVGDGKYGRAVDRNMRLMLHCFCLSLPDTHLILKPDWKDRMQVERQAIEHALSLLA